MSVYKDVMKDVRDFYKAGQKSCNKLFASKDFLSIGKLDLNEADWGAKFQQMTVRMAVAAGAEGKDKLAGRIGKRNANAPTSLANRPGRIQGENYETFGNRIYNGGLRCGNCLEMAAVSGAMMLKRGRSYSQVFMGSLLAPADHAFCAVSVSSIPPMWPTANSMVPGSQSSNTWIIDPWLNVCCEAENYSGLAQQRVKKWGQEGKRIYWAAGAQGQGWYNPDGDYAVKFGSAPLQWERFD